MRWKLVRKIALGAAGPAVAVALFSQMALAQKEPISEVIGSQIEAFRADDVATAFDFASASIRQYFGTPDRFAEMVERGYPMVLRPEEVHYLELREIAGRLWQRVMVTDRNGAIHMLDYQMIEAEDGWKINAVQLIRNLGGKV